MPEQHGNLIYDDDLDRTKVVAWAEANGLRPQWVLRDDVFVEGDTIRYREIVPAPGTEDREIPTAIPEPTPEDEFAEKTTDWMTRPLVKHPSEFGIEVAG